MLKEAEGFFYGKEMSHMAYTPPDPLRISGFPTCIRIKEVPHASAE